MGVGVDGGWVGERIHDKKKKNHIVERKTGFVCILHSSYSSRVTVAMKSHRIVGLLYYILIVDILNVTCRMHSDIVVTKIWRQKLQSARKLDKDNLLTTPSPPPTSVLYTVIRNSRHMDWRLLHLELSGICFH